MPLPRIVLDTDVVVAGLASPGGMARRWIGAALNGEATAITTVPLLLEYEDVLKRPEQLRRARLVAADIDIFLDAIMAASDKVAVHYLWRPMLRDPNDELVLEAAVNGQAEWIVTFNERDFRGAPRLGVGVGRPNAVWREIMETS